MKNIEKIILSKQQKEIMKLFYTVEPTKIVLSKKDYDKIWSSLKKEEIISQQEKNKLKKICPAIVCEIEKSVNENRLLQSAVFSECVYAQTLANIFNLTNFSDYENDKIVDEKVLNLLKSYFLVPRYIYANSKKNELLIQAGGSGGVDSALIHLTDNAIYSIEFKEQSARATTADLPQYKENGKMIITEDFIEKYPWYAEMLNEHKTLNFFEIAGHNIKNFSTESIRKAITNNYHTTKKYADVIVTVDKNEYLTMLPANQIILWAKLEGELRAARNKNKVWTPNKLKKIITEMGGSVVENNVKISKNKLTVTQARGGSKDSRYKISPIFFVYISDCKEKSGKIEFCIDDVWQLRPAISAIMRFKKLEIEKVKSYYSKELKI